MSACRAAEFEDPALVEFLEGGRRVEFFGSEEFFGIKEARPSEITGWTVGLVLPEKTEAYNIRRMRFLLPGSRRVPRLDCCKTTGHMVHGALC